MARDYARPTRSRKASQQKTRRPAKKESSRKTKKNQPRSRPIILFAAFLLVGVLAGLLIAGLAFISHHKIDHAKKAESQKTQVTQNKKPPPKTPSKPHFDFYTILPNKKVDNPKAAANNQNANAEEPVEYLLQVASVKSFQDADRLKAQLTLLGYTVFITKSKSGNTEWHRVNVGPYSSLKKAESKQDELRQNEINSLLLKNAKHSA